MLLIFFKFFLCSILSRSLDTGTSSSENTRELSPVSKSQVTSTSSKHRSRAVVKSASASGLSLMIPTDIDELQRNTGLHSPSATGGGGSSTASSRDTSPCRELSPLVTNLKPPIIIRKGPKGFGFTVHTIRVYYGDTDFYTMHHLVMAVDEGGPAFEAGLRPADLITHVNGEPVQGLYHTQVLQLLLGGVEHVSLRATPLDQTSIQSGGRKREPWQSKLAKRSLHRQRKQKRDPDKKRKTSLFRRISSKRASVEIQQMAAGISSPSMVTPSRSFQSFPRTQDCLNSSPPSIRTPPLNRSSLSPSDSYCSTSASSSSGSGTPPNNSVLASPSVVKCETKQHYQRPSTLHGLKHKLHTGGCSKTLHGTGGSSSSGSNSSGVPSRRKSVGHIPLSPLARTPSPSPLPASPTRSPSPLAFPTTICHQPGSSNTTQSYSPGSTSGGGSSSSSLVGSSTAPPPPPSKKPSGFVRPKSSEPGSPLLRRALSPDRLHPRSAETKCALISPLAGHHQSMKSGVRGSASTSSVWRPSSANTSATVIQQELIQLVEEAPVASPPVIEATAPLVIEQTNTNTNSNRLSLTLAGPGELLPRIAEEKDSPTNTQEGNKTVK